MLAAMGRDIQGGQAAGSGRPYRAGGHPLLPGRACRVGPPDQPLAVELHRARLAARAFAELTRILTGVEIHPGAVLGAGLFIDHATGVVIGETAEVGDDVTIFHGVTLGGTGADTGKRHPTVGDRVTIGAGAKVLGPIKIGDDSRIGANAVVVKEVPSGAVVVGVPGQVVSRRSPASEDDSMPDLVGVSLQSLLTRVARLEALADSPQTGRVIRPPEAGVWHGEDFSI